MKTIYVFDLGGVLINLNVARCMRAFEALMGETNMRAILGMDSNGEGVKAVSVATKQLMMDFEKGLISAEQFISEVLHYCHPGTTRQDVIDAWMSMLGNLPAEKLQFIDSLRAQGHPVYLLSNGNDLHFDYINRTDTLDSHFDGLFLSQRLHLSKPDPQIYLTVQESIHASLLPSLQGEELRSIGGPVDVHRTHGGRPLPQIIFVDDILANRFAAEQTVHWRTFSYLAELSSAL